MNLPSNAFELGRTIGFLAVIGVVLLAAAAAIVLSILDMRRKRTNPKCALAVIFAVAAGVALAIGGMFTPSPDASVRGLPGLAALIMLVIAVALAVNGLADMKRFPGFFNRGKKRAIAVLVIPFLVAGLIVIGVLFHSTGHPVFSSQIGGTAGEILTNKEWNFQWIAPPPWVSIDGAKLNPAACAGLARTGPPMSSIVIAEDLAQAGLIRLDAAVEAAKAKIKSGAKAEILDEQDQDENGLTGHRIEYVATIDGKPLYHTHWLTNRGNIFYQLVTWGPQESRDEVRTEGRKLAAGFRLIDPNLNPVAEAQRAPATFASPKFGYSIDLTNTVWTRRWANLAQEAPFAEFGVLNARGSAAFCVIPVWIGDDDVNFDALAQALAARVGIPVARESIFAVHTHVQGSVRGRAFACERTENGVSLLYRLRVLRGRGFAYLLATWMNKRSEAASEFLDLAMDCVSFADNVDRDPLIVGDRLRATHAAVWNDIGLALLRAEDAKPASALPWFQRAFEADRTNLAPLVNYAQGLIRSGRAPEALAAIDRYAHDDDRPSLHRMRAQALLANGKNDEAIRVLTDLRAATPGDSDTAASLIDAWIATQRFAEALAECDRVIAATGESIGMLQRKAVAEANLKRYREAKATLEKAHEKEPANADINRLLEQVAGLLGHGGK